MADGRSLVDAGGHETELLAIIEEVELAREEELRRARGRHNRSRIIGEIKAEALRRFAQAHPDVTPHFTGGPYRDPDAPRGQRGRKR